MNIDAYGIRLERLRGEDIELIRQKRNSPEISRFMEYQEHITSDMQMKWFNSLNPQSDFYFVIHCEGKKIGLIHTSDIHWEDKTANSGLFLWNQNYLGTHVPVLASITMLDVFMGMIGIEAYYAKVLNTNKAALIYNTKLGFEEVPGQKASKFKTLILTKEHYKERAATIRMIAERLSQSEIRLELDDSTKKLLINDKNISIPEKLLGKKLSLR